MDFHEIRFPPSLSFGSVGGPQRRTDVVSLTNGFEERNTPWAHSRRIYDAGLGMRSIDDIQVLIAFFEARMGQMYGFRWKDWSDYRSGAASAAPVFDDQSLGFGNGVQEAFQLVKVYRSGAQEYRRPITKPVAGSVRVGLAQDELREGVEYEVDAARGVIRFDHPPDPGVEIFAGYEFDVPVRFDTDRILTSVASFQAGQVPNVPVIEVRV
ncbi:TIGR02217 family protein [Sulfitobacter aestuarii]|uniref:TIGR02217 family protein n=1 Tax=Sulfitobacter aestuarii TaxID=2161676 RepID=A0ABW5U3T9_9RHOB